MSGARATKRANDQLLLRTTALHWNPATDVAAVTFLKRRDVAGTPFESHMTSAVRTFWISLIGSIVGYVLTLVLIGFAVIFVLVMWLLFRSVRGLIRAVDGRAIDSPSG